MAPSGGHSQRVRSVKSSMHKQENLRKTAGFVQIKSSLNACLNVDGLGPGSFEDVCSTIKVKNPDLCILIETKRRIEEANSDIEVDGYDLRETNRSDMANDKSGGGLAFYSKKGDGLLFKPHTPNIDDKDMSFVNKERSWLTVESASSQTAICGLYMACQHSDDKFGRWNDLMYLVLKLESAKLRAEGYRIVFIGDFNAHTGNTPGLGVSGNKPDVNQNGRRFFSFLDDTDCCHINGLIRNPGPDQRAVTTGLWTRQRNGFSTILDYAVVSREHASSVVSLEIDDRGKYGGGSDHNWLFLVLTDRFAKKKRGVSDQLRKPSWNIKDDQDWSGYCDSVKKSLGNIVTTSATALHNSICQLLLNSLTSEIGLRESRSRPKNRKLPPSLVSALNERRNLEKLWKTQQSELENLHLSRRTEKMVRDIAASEQSFLTQKRAVSDLFQQFYAAKRSVVLEDCKGNSQKARRNFWAHVSNKCKQSSDISAVISPTSGVLKCEREEIISEVENHLISVFNGSFTKVAQDVRTDQPIHSSEHSYSQNLHKVLPNIDGSATLDKDPSGWLSRDFEDKEVLKIVKQLNNCRAQGWDRIPNEAIKYAPPELITFITMLFNMVKSSGKVPQEWKRGRVVLIHKRGLREVLGNYRPLTVIICISGLYSKVLNARLTCVVEEQRILGEIQNGFRRERCGSDNIFVLDTLLWKARYLRRSVHMAFVDISKAYDSVNRAKLWARLKAMGFGGAFLESLKALYTDDSIVCEVNGLTTRPVYLQTGLRQGCSLSPILFALYISDLGSSLHSSGLGFQLGSVVISSLLFADDIALLAKTAADLLTLLNIVHEQCSSLKLVISTDKSQIVSPTNTEWQLFDDQRAPILSLKQVVSYKYLGTTTFGSMYRTSLNKQKQCIATAGKYKGSCIYVSKNGPDTAAVALCTWSNIGIPAILTGCEMIPFSENSILSIERIQAQIAKFILGVTVSTANICAQTELGLKPFRQLLWEHQLKFFFRVLTLPSSRWVRVALEEHLSGRWSSPYYSYICQLRSNLQLFIVPQSRKILMSHISEKFLMNLNSTVKSLELPALGLVKSLKCSSYVCESSYSSVIAAFKLGNAELGNRAPRAGHLRRSLCPLCPVPSPNSEFHLVMCCSALSAMRSATQISTFITSCHMKNIDLKTTYSLFLNGKNSDGKDVDVNEYLERGKCMEDLRRLWLSLW